MSMVIGDNDRIARWEFICSTCAAFVPHYRLTPSSRIDEVTISSVSFFSQAVSFFLELSSVSSSLFFLIDIAIAIQ